MSVDQTTGEIMTLPDAPAQPSTGQQLGLAPVASISQLVTSMAYYQRLCKELLDPSDYARIQGRPYRTRSAWRKLALAYAVSDEVVDHRIVEDEEGRTRKATFVVKATSAGGRRAIGVGVCSVNERCKDHVDGCEGGHPPGGRRGRERGCEGCRPCDGRRHFANPDHDVVAIAHTRAKNRALSDLFGAGAVTAEEVDGRSFKRNEYEEDM